MNAQIKQKKCRVCKKPFTPFRSTGIVCSVGCAVEFSKVRAERTKKRQKTETIGKRLQEAQQAFNAWTRWRDRDQPCISCQSYVKGKENAGHYIPAGRGAALRFDPANVHKQCEPCNTNLSGNLVRYRQGLVSRIGLAELERLEGPQPPVKWTHSQLIAIKREYRAKLRVEQASD